MAEYGSKRDFAHKNAIHLWHLTEKLNSKLLNINPLLIYQQSFEKIWPLGQGERKNPKVDSKAMTFTFDIETWFKDIVHLFPTSTIVYNIRKIGFRDNDIWFYIEVWYDLYLLPKQNIHDHCIHFTERQYVCRVLGMCHIGENIYGLGKDFTISFDLSIS